MITRSGSRATDRRFHGQEKARGVAPITKLRLRMCRTRPLVALAAEPVVSWGVGGERVRQKRGGEYSAGADTLPHKLRRGPHQTSSA
jgi:hypothetical protein